MLQVITIPPRRIYWLIFFFVFHFVWGLLGCSGNYHGRRYSKTIKSQQNASTIHCCSCRWVYHLRFIYLLSESDAWRTLIFVRCRAWRLILKINRFNSFQWIDPCEVPTNHEFYYYYLSRQHTASDLVDLHDLDHAQRTGIGHVFVVRIDSIEFHSKCQFWNVDDTWIVIAK